jgi:hypothetical protein
MFLCWVAEDFHGLSWEELTTRVGKTHTYAVDIALRVRHVHVSVIWKEGSILGLLSVYWAYHCLACSHLYYIDFSYIRHKSMERK